jgi:hypothetical protein
MHGYIEKRGHLWSSEKELKITVTVSGFVFISRQKMRRGCKGESTNKPSPPRQTEDLLHKTSSVLFESCTEIFKY